MSGFESPHRVCLCICSGELDAQQAFALGGTQSRDLQRQHAVGATWSQPPERASLTDADDLLARPLAAELPGALVCRVRRQAAPGRCVRLLWICCKQHPRALREAPSSSIRSARTCMTLWPVHDPSRQPPLSGSGCFRSGGLRLCRSSLCIRRPPRRSERGEGAGEAPFRANRYLRHNGGV